MSSTHTLSAVLEKLIRRLCLSDFPCGRGRWRESPEGPEVEPADDLLDLLTCPHSPWRCDESWSPQASALRRLAVLTPQRLNPGLIYSYFTSLRVVDQGVSVIDDGLLKFSKLEELVLSANAISEIPAENLPATLKILVLCANRLSSLRGLSSQPPPGLQHLSLSSNPLSSCEDISHLTGRHWPQLVCLDLSDCEFWEQKALLEALSGLPRLRALMLEGNPLTLTPSYPGYAVDSLPRLSYLDAAFISSEERLGFRGLAGMRDVIVNMAAATVSIGTLSGIPEPTMTEDKKTTEFPVVTYSYFISYQFLSHQILAAMKLDSESKMASRSHVTDTGWSDADLQSNCDRKTSQKDSEDVKSEETCSNSVSECSTSKLPWSEFIEFSYAQTHAIGSLGDFKKFLNQGLSIKLVEEKVLSWPVTSDDTPPVKPSRSAKEKKGVKEKEAAKDQKKKYVPELVQDAPVRRILSTAHVSLQSLLKGGQKVEVLCDLGVLHTDSEVEKTQTPLKDVDKKITGDKKKEEERESKCRGGSSMRKKNSAPTKAKGKGRKDVEVNVQKDDTSFQPEPLSLQLSVELEKWRSASEAHKLLKPQQAF